MRQPRPLRRDAQTFRDDRLFILACDDTYAPKQYFDRLKLPRVKVHVVPTTDTTSSPRHVPDRLQNVEWEEGDHRWLLLDTDHHVEANHIANFWQVLRDAREQGIQVAISRPCFELWLLLHRTQEVAGFGSAKEVERALKEHLGGYNKTNIRPERFTDDSIADAYERAKSIDPGGDIPNANATRIYLIVKQIIDGSLPAQLPPAFRRIAQSTSI